MEASISFKEAVAVAKSRISSGIENPKFGSKLSTDYLERIGCMGFSGAPHQQEVLTNLIDGSEYDLEIRKMLQLGIAHTIEAGSDLPETASRWLQKLLRGELPKCVGKKGRLENYGWQALIYHTVQDLKDDYNMNPTRNDSSPAISASDAVAEALRQLKLLPNSYDRVRKIWQEKPALRVSLERE